MLKSVGAGKRLSASVHGAETYLPAPQGHQLVTPSLWIRFPYIEEWNGGALIGLSSPLYVQNVQRWQFAR